MNREKPRSSPILILLSLLLLLLVCSAHLKISQASLQQTASSNAATVDALQQRQRIRVAAFASRLEQWFACLRANQLSEQLATNSLSAATRHEQHEQQQQQQDNQTHQSKCEAHFDGHLCWPATGAGERVKLACPRLNWSLVSQQQQQAAAANSELRSVINSALVDNNQITTTSTTNASQPFVSAVADTSAATTTTISQPVSKPMQEAPKFAYRTCGGSSVDVDQKQENRNGGASIISRMDLLSSSSPPPIPVQKSPAGGWLTNEADYSQCSQQRQPLLSSSSSPSSLAAFDLASFDPADHWIKLDQVEDRSLFERLQQELDRIEGAIDPYADPELLQQWTLCINNIMLEQQGQHRPMDNGPHSAQQPAAAASPSGDPWCPIIFDGWRCWPSTRASDVAYVSCPSNQPGFSAERKAHKICTPNGTWYKHPMTNRYWSNYTTCVDTVDLAFRTKILNLYVIGNLISLVALSASLIIFISFKSLNCTRVTIHKNLFLSFITNNLMWIIWYTCVVNNANLLQSNPIGCQLWHILLHYFLVSNYFWMFCEGLYLHTLLVVAFVSENKILKWFYLLGWLTPIPITVAYAYNRSYDEYYTNFCWMEESPYNLILMAPIGISLLLNLVFLINIVRVLVTKLRANNSPDTHQTRKAVRATLILIPLLGLHYMLTPFRPEAKSEWEVIYEIVAAVCTSFQGLCVAMLFCFCNAEVIAVIKKKLKDTFNMKQQRQFRNGHSHHQMRSRSNTLLEAGAVTGGTNCAPNSGRFNSIAVPGTGFDLRAPSSLIKAKDSLVAAAADAAANNNNNNIHHINNSRSNGSNSSSLLTNVTASPVYSNDSHPVVCGGDNPITANSVA